MQKYKIAIAGCGGMANTWVKYAISREDAEIVALVDIYIESANKMAKSYNLDCGTYTNLEEAIIETGANLVFDITIPESHKNIALKAFEKGCDVLGEKPMASSMDEAEEMLKASQKNNRKHSVMQNRRYLKNIRSLRTIVESGKIGEIGMTCADFFLGPHFGGFRDIMDSPLLLDMSIHTFDQARFITGADAVAVYCHEFNPVGSWYKGNASAICIFEMSNGSVFCYRGSWCSEGLPTSWEAEWRVTGSNGTAIWDGNNSPYYEAKLFSEANAFTSQFERVEPTLEWVGREGHEGCLDEMFLALEEGRKAETDCSDNIKSMEMVFAAIESARTGKKVYLKHTSNK